MCPQYVFGTEIHFTMPQREKRFYTRPNNNANIGVTPKIIDKYFKRSTLNVNIATKKWEDLVSMCLSIVVKDLLVRCLLRVVIHSLSIIKKFTSH